MLIILSIGFATAFIPLIIIIILIAAAAGLSRGYSIFNLFTFATLFGFGFAGSLKRRAVPIGSVTGRGGKQIASKNLRNLGPLSSKNVRSKIPKFVPTIEEKVRGNPLMKAKTNAINIIRNSKTIDADTASKAAAELVKGVGEKEGSALHKTITNTLLNALDTDDAIQLVNDLTNTLYKHTKSNYQYLIKCIKYR